MVYSLPSLSHLFMPPAAVICQVDPCGSMRMQTMSGMLTLSLVPAMLIVQHTEPLIPWHLQCPKSVPLPFSLSRLATLPLPLSLSRLTTLHTIMDAETYPVAHQGSTWSCGAAQAGHQHGAAYTQRQLMQLVSPPACVHPQHVDSVRTASLSAASLPACSDPDHPSTAVVLEKAI